MRLSFIFCKMNVGRRGFKPSLTALDPVTVLRNHIERFSRVKSLPFHLSHFGRHYLLVDGQQR